MLVFTNVSGSVSLAVVVADAVVVSLYVNVLFTGLVVLLKGAVVLTNV